MARVAERIYDPSTGTWTKSVAIVKEDTPTTQDTTNTGNDNLTSSSSDSSSAQGATEKDYNLIEYNILTGDLSFIPDKKTIKIKAGDTITLDGLGKYLSGDYYVQDVTRTINSSGYSHTATLIKTDFGATLKTSNSGSASAKETSTVDSTATDSKNTSKTHVLKKGQTLWGLAVIYYNDGSKYPKIAEANNVTPEQFTKLPIGKKITIP